MQSYDIHKAKAHLSRLVEQAAKGEPFVIAKAGRPLVKVVALGAPGGNQIVTSHESDQMSPKDFIDSVTESYEEARSAKIAHERIQRIKSGPIYSTTEDLLAYYIVSNIKDVDVKINQTIRYGYNTFIPDISICRRNSLVCLFEVKQDMGWCRNLHEQVKKYDSQIMGLIRSERISLTKQNEKDNHEVYSVSPSLKRCFVIISDMNIGSDRRAENVYIFGKSKYNGMVFLTSGCHPNSHKDDMATRKRKIIVNYKSFEDILVQR